MNKWIIGIALFVVAILTVPQVNYVAHKLELIYCDEQNEWVRPILIKFAQVGIPGYPEGGICN